MENLKLFKNETFGEIRTLLINDEVWFVGKDIAEALGYSNPQKAIRTHVDDEDKGVNEMDTPGGKQEIIIINESGLYSLILSSKLPQARQFKRWITSEVLPSIRQNGGYIQNQEELSNEELLAKALMVAQNVIANKDKQITEMKPKADYFDALVDRNLLTNFRDTAKELGVNQNKFIDYLLDNGYIYRDKSGKLKPYSQFNKDLFEIKEYKSDNGFTGNQTLITPKGRETFRLLLQNI